MNEHPMISIIYEDSDLIVLDKPAGVVIHVGTGHEEGLVEMLKAFIADRDGLIYVEHIAPVHRLDRDTSGVTVFGKTPAGLRELGRLFEEGHVEKTYLVLCKGFTHKKGRIDLPLVARPEPSRARRPGAAPQPGAETATKKKEEALTEYQRLAFVRGMSLLRVTPRTGRTHQIRRHLRAIGHPVAGDTRWGEKGFNRFLIHKGLLRPFIHAVQLKFVHPILQQELALTAPLPEALEQLLIEVGFPPPDQPRGPSGPKPRKPRPSEDAQAEAVDVEPPGPE